MVQSLARQALAQCITATVRALTAQRPSCRRDAPGHSRGAINATLFGGRHPGAVPLLLLVAGRLDLRINMVQRFGADVLQRLRESGPWLQETRRDGDGARITWQLTAQVSMVHVCVHAGLRVSLPSHVRMQHRCTQSSSRHCTHAC